MLNTYLLFINKFQNTIKTEYTYFVAPSNYLIKKLLDILMRNNLIQQYILIENKKNVLVYLYPNKIKSLKNFLKPSNKKFFNKLDLKKYNENLTFNEKILILSNNTGLVTNTNNINGGMLLLEILIH